MKKTTQNGLDTHLKIGQPIDEIDPNPYARRWAKAWAAVEAAKGKWVPFTGPKAVLKALAGTARTNPRTPRDVRVLAGTVYIRSRPTRMTKLRAQSKA